MRGRNNLFLFLLIIFIPVAGKSQSRTWDVAVAAGATVNIKSPLGIHQADESIIKVKAKYKTEPFKPPVYYDLRITSWKGQKGLALKFTHHKIILTNMPPEVQRFSITDGFNLLTLNRLWLINGFTYSVGGGIVITHPESTIRNQVFPENKGIFNQGYFVSGPTLETALGKQFNLAEKWLVLVEGRFTASYVDVPVQNGHANVTNLALHLQTGLGYKFIR